MKDKIKKPVTYAFIDASNIIYGALDDIKHELVFHQTKTRLVPGNVEVNPTDVFTSRDYKKSIARVKKFVKHKK